MTPIEPVPKGEFGGDTLHRVGSPNGVMSGTILWETKRTKNWSNAWLAKLRDDQRTAKADLAVLVSQTLPDGVETFDVVEGVWVTHPRCVLASRDHPATYPSAGELDSTHRGWSADKGRDDLRVSNRPKISSEGGGR